MPVPAAKHHSLLFWVLVVAIAMVLLLASQALRAQVWTQSMERLSLRAGPFRDFPEIAWIAPGEDVVLYGCLADHGWCEVSWNRYRGWVEATPIGVQRAGWGMPPGRGGGFVFRSPRLPFM